MIKHINNIRQDKLKLREQATFLAVLAKLLNNGFSIEIAFESMVLIFPAKKNLLKRLIQRLNLGYNLATSLQITGLSKTILSQIAIADVHGNLIKCLSENAATLTINQKNRRKVLNLLAYPCFLLVSLLSLLVFLKIEMAQQLPQISLTQKTRLIVIVVILVITIFIVRELIIFYSSSELKRAQRQMHWPFIGGIYKNYFHYVVLSAIATFLKSGLSLNEILLASNQLTPGSIQQQLASKVQKQILAGQSLSQIIEHNNLLPSEINIAVSLGHDTTRMAWELQTIGEIKHERLQQQLQKLINQIQPIFFLLVAALILGTYLSILLPIYSMMKGL